MVVPSALALLELATSEEDGKTQSLPSMKSSSRKLIRGCGLILDQHGLR